MDLDLTEEQELLRDTTRHFLADNWPTRRVRVVIDDLLEFDRSSLSDVAELGWFSVLVDDDWQFRPAGVGDLAIIIEELGRHVFPGPVIPNNLLVAAIARWGTVEQRTQYLPLLTSGSVVGSWAFTDTGDTWGDSDLELQAVHIGSGYRITGSKCFVEEGPASHILLVTTRSSDGLVNLVVPAETEGVTSTQLHTLDLTRRLTNFQFDGVFIPNAAKLGADSLDSSGETSATKWLLNLALALQCAETVGVTDAVFDLTLQYAKDRKAFGRAIGSFQALKHRLADMALWLESSKAAAVAAVRAVQSEVNVDHDVSVAKAFIGQYASAIVRDCLQIHGGIGFTWEHDLHLYLRRIESNRALYGDPDSHLDRLAEILKV